ncbi:HEPN domain-containing protein [Hydrogenimonas thermophila]|uniref:HEPN domain-containing protein n=1 Tax=Hydrogenimonas thermophila TaxID=223786 RepID=UPI0029371627|nr:HEPN domain-containing protein [Hydrogenimonas thermophila]WOE69064.1 HEPN domain-containing protein [Hydrogenimonas thermophila]WOE71574.1 HEPN domain-containing protein [Hydrogenimonas thermophila]
MANRVYAKEWLQFCIKNLDTARLLFEANHYEDIIGVELQQALEKMLKSILAYHNRAIPKTHKLLEIVAYIDEIEFNANEIRLLETATNYYRVDRYPNPNYFLPSREEIKEVLDFAEKLFNDVCQILNIDQK